jgi:excisionase family DNA binding protein
MPAAAAELGVHPTTVRRYAAEGRIRLVRVGPRKTGVRRSELERFLAAQPAPHAPPAAPLREAQ